MRFSFKECEQIAIILVMDTSFFFLTKYMYSVSQLQKSKTNLYLSNGNKSMFSDIFSSIPDLTSVHICDLFFPFSFHFYLFTFIESLCVYTQKYCNHTSVIKQHATAMLRTLYKASSNVRKLKHCDKLRCCVRALCEVHQGQCTISGKDL